MITNFVFYNEYDDSYLLLYSEILTLNLFNFEIYLIKVDKCLAIYEDLEEDVSPLIKRIIEYHPWKIDLLYLIGFDTNLDFSESEMNIKKTNSYFPFHYYPKPTLRL